MSRFFSSAINDLIVKCKFACPQKVRLYSLRSSRFLRRNLPRNCLHVYQQSRGVRTAVRSLFASFKSTKLRFWILGVGAGSVLALGIKDHVYVGSECEEKTAREHIRNGGFDGAVKVSRDLLQRIKDEVGAPGIVVGVSVDGVPVWSEGLGYADLENRVPCRAGSVMRIASISKSLTTTAAARLWEQGLLDLDVPVQKYVPEFPEKEFEGKPVTITTRMLLSHLSGIRHYEKDSKKVREEKETTKRPPGSPGRLHKEDKGVDGKEKNNDVKKKETGPGRKKREFEQEEYYLKQNFDSVVQALELFKNDPLVFKPGTTFLYSTHAFTLLSAVVERAAGQRFLDHMTQMFRDLGMLNTMAEENDPIIYHRSRFYHRNKKGRIVNCPYVDNSYKWAGGGFLSTVGDLLLFGDAMLYSYQMAHMKDEEELLPGFLKPQTAAMVWAPVDKTEGSWDKDGRYGMGWLVVEKHQEYGQCRKRRHYISHTGGAVGASSVLLVLPKEPQETPNEVLAPPRGVVVAVLINMQSVGLNGTALKIAQEFDKATRD
ncbi:serine beta-lactamase-like protein LACTB, mitochondrial isoform X2 [Brienomyrus brachyistius]|uniref:serine beta-lactamase-like protein LACTB, mitochondrial isoform X2 n=1 Tax=Brienomyrus brachyistius TaxID=42636 RepID=UPI0020B3B5F8|nr:serine beta-lactamase-like protein LACTB, mitochondrial isoform X2 [Brienomyrus brachyistius]